MGEHNLELNLSQALTITSNMLQSIEILQMDSFQLMEYVKKKAEENPLIEHADTPSASPALQELQKTQPWIRFDGYALSTSDGNNYMDSIAAKRSADTLEEFLCDQLERKKMEAPILCLCKYLVNLLNVDGYLTEDDLESVRALKVPKKLLQDAICVLQALEPVGIAGRDLSECLCLQLRRRYEADTLALTIAETHLEALGKKHYSQIAKVLGVSEEDVRKAESVIRALDPRPGACFSTDDEINYIHPDVFAIVKDGTVSIVINDFNLPKLSVSGYYARMIKETTCNETKKYLQNKTVQAKWLMNCLELRHATLKKCVDIIGTVQADFFLSERHTLAPLSLFDVSSRLGVHESTVSRAIKGKYLQCTLGTFPLRYFFSRSLNVDSGKVSAQYVRQTIAAIIRSEQGKPLSDQKITDRLAQQGINISRRTVTKYRLQLHIDSTLGRKYKQ